MAKNGKKLTLSSDKPRFGSKALVTSDQEKLIERRKIAFSFSYFRQITNFQIGACPPKWHVGFLERMSILGTMTPQEVLEENRGSESLRCHPIDWNAKNIPVRRSNLDWLPQEILDNETEFPMMQFSISAGTGRMIGFFNRDSSVFYITLLDPNHNIQPSKKTNYQIQPTTQGISQYDDLLNKLENIKKVVKDCKDKSCKLHVHIHEMEGLHHNITYVGLDKDFYSSYQEILQEHSLQEILENGILSLTNKN